MNCSVSAVCSAKNFALVKSLGAEKLIDYNQEDFTKSGETYDIIFDTVGKTSFKNCKKILSEKGIYMSPVLTIPLLADMFKTSLFQKKKALFQATGTKSDDKLKELLKELVGIYKAGRLQTVIDRVFPLEQLPDAHRYIERGHKRGNIVIINSNGH